MSTNGEQVSAFEKALAEYCQARFCVAAGNGTVTLQAALIALGVKPGDRVGTTPLTMAATTIAILNIGAVPTYHDVDPDTWLMRHDTGHDRKWRDARIPVSLYGLHVDSWGPLSVDDAAQTFRKHGGNAFTSISFQSSKLLNLGEGGALLTDDEELAEKARSYLSLGYKMSATQARINPATLKDPSFERHHLASSINGRMNDITAAEGLRKMKSWVGECASGSPEWGGHVLDWRIQTRRDAANFYRQAIQGCPWITPQAIPEGSSHDMWTFAVALHDKALWHPFTDSIVKHGGERPYGAWKLSYQEPVFRHLAPLKRWQTCPKCGSGRMYSMTWSGEKPEWQCRGCSAIITPIENESSGCPIAEDLQPRLVHFQTNCLISAERNAEAVYKAIQEIGG